MNTKTKIILAVILIVLLLPLWMWLAWLCTPKKKFVVAIVDKTEITPDGEEHVSLSWILNHERYTKTRSDLYNNSRDYFGFFPLKKEKFLLKGLERFSDQQLEQLSDDCDAVYFTDTYGVFSNEWYTGKNVGERSGIVYGGMSKEDIWMLSKMKQKHKLIITEFNSIGSPTSADTRTKFEDLFGLKWSGWIGRYFETLDTVVNKELPHWLINNYLQQNGSKWPFTRAGVVFVNNQDEVVVLEKGQQLSNDIPCIITSAAGQSAYHLPEKMNYTFWFDVMEFDHNVDQSIAHFHIDANETGKKLLSSHNIPSEFPAVIQHTGQDYHFYYFCADFCDNPIGLTSSYFEGVSLLRSLFYNKEDVMERKYFFWNYYRPLLTAILSNQYSRK